MTGKMPEGSCPDETCPQRRPLRKLCCRATCNVDDCTSAPKEHGMCFKHSRRLMRTGTLDEPKSRATDPLERLLARVEEDESGCWLIVRGPLYRGYGRVSVLNKNVPAHRLTWEFFNGPIPDGLTIDHLCRVTNCVNPWHFDVVPPGVNVEREHAARTHCTNGHEFTPENTYLSTWQGHLSRQCRTCGRASQARYKAKRRAGEAA